ncbi:MAG: hypothetical protein SFU98_10095 [Leptospiraceae bacterium]|nr:hypothetical protein [Leptospiraceae bacterium]
MASAFKGLLIGSILASLFYAIFFMGFPLNNILTKEILYFYFIPFLLIGFFQGLIASKIYTNRFKKLFLLCILMIFVVCMVFAGFMILNEPEYPIQKAESWIAVLQLGSMGFGIFGVLTLPFSLIGTFLVELWTNPRF